MASEITLDPTFQRDLRKKVLKQPRPFARRYNSHATALLEKRQEVLEVQASLDAQKEEYSLHEANIRKREEELKRRDYELQESLMKFNRFLLDNDTKRDLAEKKAEEEARQKEEKTRELQALRQQFEGLLKEKEEKQALLQKYRRYQKYLHSVVECAEEYAEVRQIITRWKTLEKAGRMLQKRIAKCQEENEKLRNILLKYTEEKSNEILEYNNEIAKLQKQLEQRTSLVNREQSQLDEKTESNVNKALAIGQIKMACANILKRLSDGGRVKVKTKGDTLQQLEVIRSCLDDMAAITSGAPQTRKSQEVRTTDAEERRPPAAPPEKPRARAPTQQQERPQTRSSIASSISRLGSDEEL